MPLGDAQPTDQTRLYRLNGLVAIGEQVLALWGQIDLDHTSVRHSAAACHQTGRLQMGDDLVHGLGRDEAPTGQRRHMYTGVAEGFTVEHARANGDQLLRPLRLDRAVLPHMRRHGQGLLVHVSSVAGGLTFPFLAQYSASKMAVEALAEGTRVEVTGRGDVPHRKDNVVDSVEVHHVSFSQSGTKDREQAPSLPRALGGKGAELSQQA